MSDKIRFIDCNHPGVVYIGTAEDMEWLREDGGVPHPVGDHPIEDEEGVWPERNFGPSDNQSGD